MHIKITSTGPFSTQECETVHYMDDLPGVDDSPYCECPVCR